MKIFPVFVSARCAALATAIMFSGAGESPAFLGLFESDTSRKVPDATQLASQEAEASALVAQAAQYEASNQAGKAQSIYKKIVKSFPRTQAASDSQFKVAEIYQAEGKSKRAFEEYQDFLSEYKSSPRFKDAVQRQFDIAETLRATGSKGFLGGLGATIQPSKLLEFYQLISVNSPRTDLAAKSYLAIGAVQSSQGELASAIIAYESVVENFPNTNYASEAQFQLFNLHGRESKKSFSEVDMQQQREAGEDFLLLHRDDPRSNEIKAALGTLEDRESEKAFNVGRFYERSGNLKSAMIYYRQVAKSPGTKNYEDARKRMARLIEKDPSLASVAQQKEVAVSSGSPAPAAPRTASASSGVPLPTKPAQPSLKKSLNFLGPPPPSADSSKPRMRTSQDDVLPIPTDDPAASQN